MRVVVISDFDFKGSGYFNIAVPICEGLSKRNHDIKVIGLNYRGEEHFYNFSMLAAGSSMEAVMAILMNLYNVWKFDVLLVALDIPLQEGIMSRLVNRDFGYVGIFPIEADPLSFKWATVLSSMDKAYVISKFGAKEAQKIGVTRAEYLPIGIDLKSWRMPSDEEYKKFRDTLGFSEEDFVVLTVADNQERKNLGACMQAFGEFHETYPNSKYIIVTRKNNLVGWTLDELAIRYKFVDDFVCFERGMGFSQLWSLYAASDAFLLLSKAEGLSMPCLEAMATGLPVIATNCTALTDHLSNEKGFLVDYYDIDYIDPFGNGNRYFAKQSEAANTLLKVANGDWKHDLQKVMLYLENLKWENTVDILDRGLNEYNSNR